MVKHCIHFKGVHSWPTHEHSYFNHAYAKVIIKSGTKCCWHVQDSKRIGMYHIIILLKMFYFPDVWEETNNWLDWIRFILCFGDRTYLGNILN